MNFPNNPTGYTPTKLEMKKITSIIRGDLAEGHKNVRITYYAGYSSSNMPKDLKLAIKIIVAYMYEKRDSETFGMGSYKVGDIQVASEGGVLKPSIIPKEASNILDKYVNWEIV